jgi:hypothetical protein
MNSIPLPFLVRLFRFYNESHQNTFRTDAYAYHRESASGFIGIRPITKWVRGVNKERFDEDHDEKLEVLSIG